MDEGKRRTRLGRGLDALFAETSADYAEADRARPSLVVPIEHVEPGRFQPRRAFDEASLAGLAESVRARGILQPLLVRRHPERLDRYEIIAGERRWRAAQRAQLHEVPVILRELDDREALEVALIENVQRQDLTPLEEAEGYRRLMDEFRRTAEELGRAVGKSRSHVANTLRLLGLPDAVKELVQSGALTAGHARALLAVPDPAAAARDVVRRGLNVRQTEGLAHAAEASIARAKAPAGAAKDADTRDLEQELTERLGLAVTIEARGAGGTLAIRYRTLDQLDAVLARLRRP